MFRFGKSKRVAECVKSLQIAITQQSYIFAGGLSKEIDPHFEDVDVPRFKKLITPDDQDLDEPTTLNQVAFANEALAFFLHVLARRCYAARFERIGEVVLKPTIVDLLELSTRMADVVVDEDIDSVRAYVNDLFWRRDKAYGACKSAIGEDRDDQSSALHAAALLIATEAQPGLIKALEPEFGENLNGVYLLTIVKTLLLQGVLALKLPDRLEALISDLR